jgi:murein DD-endopeptidase MepM/ murein hydrolase activator NlpD
MRRPASSIAVLCVLALGIAAAPAAAKTSGGGHAVRHLQHALIFRWPEHGVITTPFTSYHKGIDIGMLHDLSIRAAHSGRVIHVGYTTGFEGYGQIVDVVVRPGIETLYAHMSGERVHVGQRIHAGELLGTAGCTGICTGTHLHFEVREHGVAVDPRRFLH